MSYSGYERERESVYIYIYIYIYIDIGIMVRVFANGSGDQSSIPGRVIPKTQKMVLDATLLNTQRVCIYIYIYTHTQLNLLISNSYIYMQTDKYIQKKFQKLGKIKNFTKSVINVDFI